MATIKIEGEEKLDRLAKRVEGADARLLAQSLNRVMAPTTTSVRRELARSTGAPYGRVMRAVRGKPATLADISYSIDANDTFLDLSSFKARQNQRGVSAAPWRQRHTFPGTFIIKKWGGRVYTRVKNAALTPEAEDRIRELGKFNLKGSSRFPIRKLWGPNIAREMLRRDGSTIGVWREDIGKLRRRIVIEVQRRLKAGV